MPATGGGVRLTDAEHEAITGELLALAPSVERALVEEYRASLYA